MCVCSHGDIINCFVKKHCSSMQTHSYTSRLPPMYCTHCILCECVCLYGHVILIVTKLCTWGREIFPRVKWLLECLSAHSNSFLSLSSQPIMSGGARQSPGQLGYDPNLIEIKSKVRILYQLWKTVWQHPRYGGFVQSGIGEVGELKLLWYCTCTSFKYFRGKAKP